MFDFHVSILLFKYTQFRMKIPHISLQCSFPFQAFFSFRLCENCTHDSRTLNIRMYIQQSRVQSDESSTSKWKIRLSALDRRQLSQIFNIYSSHTIQIIPKMRLKSVGHEREQIKLFPPFPHHTHAVQQAEDDTETRKRREQWPSHTLQLMLCSYSKYQPLKIYL